MGMRECLGKCVTGLGRMRVSDTHWIGFPTAGSSRMSVGYAVKHAPRCGFVAYGCRIRTEVSLSAGSSQACVEQAPRSAARCGFGTNVRRTSTGACPRCLFDVSVRHMCSGACARCLFGACVRRIRTEAGSRLVACRHRFDRRGSQRETLPAGITTGGSQNQSHTCRGNPHLPRRSCRSPAIRGYAHKETVSRNAVWT
ncbi:hypothetical protein BTIS_0795 [Bifidobacterium tissieri]|uniref:Uncharacterized protein n=1 Tax=Bifidobacterium tissieri TaxID=1630162 RepID=A0A261FHS5_9BIFI|nr:hypothetical protein BTIS_0795 [Bifidobacterium tissieri]